MNSEQLFNTKSGEAILICAMQQSDIEAADRVMRLAFGTFLKMPDPAQFMGDASYIPTRWTADPAAAFCAKINHEVIGSVLASNWGSVGFFGPLTIHPKFWDQGVAQLLMVPVMECFRTWRSEHLGLFTFAQSIKHVSLYRKFGFYPRFLTVILSKPVGEVSRNVSWTCFSDAAESERGSLLKQCRALTDSVYGGLDLTREIESVFSQGLGETVLLWDGHQPTGMAVCHAGPGTEAGSESCYIKFAIVGGGPGAAKRFVNLLVACEQLARKRSLTKITGGVNTARKAAYELMLANGYTAMAQGVAMEQPGAGYNREDVFLIDDWR